jgi:hypothetical protein
MRLSSSVYLVAFCSMRLLGAQSQVAMVPITPQRLPATLRRRSQAGRHSKPIRAIAHPAARAQARCGQWHQIRRRPSSACGGRTDDGRDPVAVYHTHNPTPDAGAVLKDPLPVPQTTAPQVDISSVQQTIFHWNTALPEDNGNPYFVRTPNGRLYAKDKTGLILLEYRENGVFKGIEIVALRSDKTRDGITRVDLGSQILPFVAPTNPAPPVVIKGLGTGPPESVFVHRHSVATSPQFNQLYAVRKTDNPEDIEVYWMKRSVLNVVWPYELHRYTAAWPTDDSKYQLYVRGVAAPLGPNVEIPAAKP